MVDWAFICQVGLDNNVNLGCIGKPLENYTQGNKFFVKKTRLVALCECTVMYARDQLGVWAVI